MHTTRKQQNLFAPILLIALFTIGLVASGAYYLTRTKWLAATPTPTDPKVDIKEATPEAKKNPKPRDMGVVSAELVKDVPSFVEQFRASKYKSKAISYELHPTMPELFLTLTIEIPPAYLSDAVLPPRWYTKASFTSAFPVRSGVTMNLHGHKQAISAAQASALNASDTGWGKVEFLP